MNTQTFYRAFEDKYRGDRSIIKQWLLEYTPFLEALLNTMPAQPKALDLGCGRGEWLEVLKEKGFDATGVDLDEGMLEACTHRGLHVQHQDCFEALQAQPPQSLCLISGFHLAEHLSFDQLQQLFSDAHTALKEGGLLILETPYAENIRVGTSQFYLDPTHQRPLPDRLLTFLAEYHGFARATTRYLHEAIPLNDQTPVSLFHVIAGGAQDYALIAQKQSSAEHMRPFDTLFIPSQNSTTDYLAQCFEMRIRELENRCLEMNARIDHLTHLYTSMLNTLSWKITKPLRWITQYLK